MFKHIHLLLSACLLLYGMSTAAAENTLVLGDGLSVRVLYFEPENATAPPPLAILLSGGLNNEFMARAQFWLGKEMVNRGWAIVVPMTDQGRNFFTEHSSLMSGIVAQLHERYAIKDQKPLIMGISSGGSAALAIAAQNPRDYLGVIATPGRLLEEYQLGELEGLPIFLRVGEKDDFRWNRKLAESESLLTDKGARVDAALVAGAHHIFTLNWDEIERWLETILQSEPRGL